MNSERVGRSMPGIPVFLVLSAIAIAIGGAMAWWIVNVIVPMGEGDELLAIGGFMVLILVLVVDILLYVGLTPVNPNEARALVLFGRYAGTIRTQGLHWVNPLTERRRISVRVRNFETSRLKVNDHDGNPVEIAAVVVWKVTDTAEALFEVDDFENFVHVQAESALRNLATSHPYDGHQEGDIALRSNPVEIAAQLRGEIQDRLQRAGVEVIEARISHLAYAPEIANAMLRRQQANAVIAARSRIVEGAVSMVEMALEQLSQRQVVELDEERKAAMVSNLLVVLCSEHETQPVVNTGTLYAYGKGAGPSPRTPPRLRELLMAERKSFLLRLDPETFDAIQRWASDEMRSVNGHVEFILRRALRDAGRLPDSKRAAGGVRGAVRKAPQD